MNDTLNEEYLTTSSLKLIAFLHNFTQEDFRFSVELPARQDKDGYWAPAWTNYTTEASCFLKVCREAGFIDPHWMQSSVMADNRAHKLRNGAIPLDHITITDTAYLLTFLSRQERFTNGAFAHAFNDGIIISILRRLDQLTHEKNR